MEESSSFFQKDLFANLQLSLVTSAYTHCWETWRDIEYIPDYNKFYFIIGGEGWLKIGDREFYPKPGQLFLMPAGILQSYSIISKDTFRKYWCHFTAKIGDVNLFNIINTPYFVEVEDTSKVEMLFKELIKEQENPKLYARLREKALLMEILSYYVANSQIEEFKFVNSSSMSKLNRVLQYIQDHIAEEITVEQLASMLHFHPGYFTKVFKKYIGLSPSQYVNKVRLDKAKFLLKNTDLQVTEVAAKTGFCDIYHFSKTFKAYSGFSPTDYRSI